MPEEATEQMVAELAKELIVKGTGITLKFSKTVAEVSARSVAAKASEHRNTGRMDVKRLYKVSRGNLAQIKLDQQSLVKDLEKELKKNGVNYAIENGHDGSRYLNVSGDDVAHASHIIDQVLAKYAVISDDKLNQATIQLQDQNQQEPPLADTAEFPAITAQKTALQATPQSLQYVPDQEETDYLESMGFSESAQYEPAPKLTDYHEKGPETINFTPTDEEAQYMASMGFDERPPYMSAQEDEHAIEEHMSRDASRADNAQPSLEPHRLHQSTQATDETERIESQTDGTQDLATPDPRVQWDDAEPGYEGGTPDPDPGMALDTHKETSVKRTNGRVDRKLTTRQKLRKMIDARAQEKIAAHTDQRLSRDMKPDISHPNRRK